LGIQPHGALARDGADGADGAMIAAFGTLHAGSAGAKSDAAATVAVSHRIRGRVGLITRR